MRMTSLPSSLSSLSLKHLLDVENTLHPSPGQPATAATAATQPIDNKSLTLVRAGHHSCDQTQHGRAASVKLRTWRASPGHLLRSSPSQQKEGRTSHHPQKKTDWLPVSLSLCLLQRRQSSEPTTRGREAVVLERPVNAVFLQRWDVWSIFIPFVACRRYNSNTKLGVCHEPKW